MLQSYQQAVETVVQKDFYPGVSADELERFKIYFRTSAYTCRLRFCPRATIGFDNKQLRYEHEITHATFRCIQPDCQYPPFQSSQTLKAHMNKFHSLLPPRKPIRRPGIDHFRIQQSSFSLPSGARTREDHGDVKTEGSGHTKQHGKVQHLEHDNMDIFNFEPVDTFDFESFLRVEDPIGLAFGGDLGYGKSLSLARQHYKSQQYPQSIVEPKKNTLSVSQERSDEGPHKQAVRRGHISTGAMSTPRWFDEKANKLRLLEARSEGNSMPAPASLPGVNPRNIDSFPFNHSAVDSIEQVDRCKYALRRKSVG
jgi:hypothetical protein